MSRPGYLMACAALLAMVGSRAVARAEGAPSPSPAATPPAATALAPAAPTAAAVPAPPPTAHETPPPPDEYRPLASYQWRGWSVQAPLLLEGRAEAVSSFPVDRDLHDFQSGLALSPLLRVGLRIENVVPLAKRFHILLEYEHDLPTGTWTSDTPIAGEGLPNSAPLTTQLRKASAIVAMGPDLQIGAGFMTSDWGLGLVANDGTHAWEPGSANFTDPRLGDLVLRAFVSTGPLTRAHLVAFLAFDKVRADDVLLPGDSAYEIIASALAGYEQPVQGGFFLVHRRQTAADGSTLNVTVIDIAGRAVIPMRRAKLTLEAEGALVFGATTLGASPEIPSSAVLQIGAALRASLAFKRTGGVLDLLYASGDQNNHDAGVNGFHVDPNFETGLLLFHYVQTAQTGRGYATAADPQLVGAPPSGIDRLPTRGGLTNAIVAFPRLWVRPAPGLEAYGGVLFALAPVKNIDPFNTELSGGSPRNALGGNPGSYWGTEFDVGLRYRVYLHGTELTVGAEGGLLLPGSALQDAAGRDPERVFGGRLMFAYRL